LLDVVELRVVSGRWPAGTVGTVVEVFSDGVMVEIADEQGRGIDFLELPMDAVSVSKHPQQKRLAV
jgi:uncharacterized protein DUF4926